MREADTNRDGYLSHAEFLQWEGRTEVLGWLTAHNQRVLAQFRGAGEEVADVRSSMRFAWEGVAPEDVVKAFRAETWVTPPPSPASLRSKLLAAQRDLLRANPTP